MADLSDYTNLVPSANAKKPNFLAMLGAVVQPLVDGINVIQSLPALMDVDIAAGDQLDIIGEWVNFPRKLSVPITGVYFGFGVGVPGFGAGIWLNPDEPEDELIELDDVTYRQMIMVKIAANNWDGSMRAANQSLVNVFGSQGDPPVIWITDNFDMTMSYHTTTMNALLQQLVASGLFPFKIAGVRLV